jgi:hypothetical protein
LVSFGSGSVRSFFGFGSVWFLSDLDSSFFKG